MRAILLYLSLGVILVATLFYLVDGLDATISAVVAYISASLIIVASMSSYRKMVESRLASGIIPQEERDELDKIEDPHSLYEETNEDKDIQKIIKEEKLKLKQSKRGLRDTLKDSLPALSPIKIGSYLLLAVGFIWLKNSSMMVLYAYLISLSIPMFIIVYLLIDEKR